MSVSVDVTGVPETLRALGRIDPELRKAAVREFRSIGNELRREARASIPATPAVSGWRTTRTRRPENGPGVWTVGRLAYRPGKVRSGITVRFSARSAPGRPIRLVTLRNANAAGAILEIAGRRRSNRLSRALDESGWPKAGRVAWRTVDRNRARIDAGVRTAVDNMTATLNAALRR